jgi:hypothetical protein
MPFAHSVNELSMFIITIGNQMKSIEVKTIQKSIEKIINLNELNFSSASFLLAQYRNKKNYKFEFLLLNWIIAHFAEKQDIDSLKDFNLLAVNLMSSRLDELYQYQYIHYDLTAIYESEIESRKQQDDIYNLPELRLKGKELKLWNILEKKPLDTFGLIQYLFFEKNGPQSFTVEGLEFYELYVNRLKNLIYRVRKKYPGFIHFNGKEYQIINVKNLNRRLTI